MGVDTNKLKNLAERALGSSFNADAMSSPLGQFCAAAKPQAILELIERLERAEKDAERYRWLREQPNDCSAPRIDVVRWEPMDESANEGEGLRLEALDAAIDAALEGGGR